jgi:glycerophosphoryl diester phosphodiesterase
MLELDVMVTVDDELVVHHDDTVDRLTDGSGVVREMELAQVQSLDAAFWFLPDCVASRARPASEYVFRGVRTGRVAPPPGAAPDDFCVPTFREVALEFPDRPLDVEIKGDRESASAAVPVLAAELEALDRVDSTVVVSFDSAIVEQVRARLPTVALSPGLDTLVAWATSDGTLGQYATIQVPPLYDGIDVVPLVLERAHAEGIAVWVWPNDPDTQENTAYYRHLIDAGVDGVIAASPRRWPR